MANDHISPLKKGTRSEPNPPSPGETTALRGACALSQRAAIPRPDARSHARQNNFVTNVNGHLADVGLAAGAVGADIWVKVGDPPRLHPLPVRRPKKREVEKKRGHK